MDKEYVLKEEYIELFKLLKLVNIAATGGHGKIMIEDGEVEVNGDVEYRKRAKIRSGFKVVCNGISIAVK